MTIGINWAEVWAPVWKAVWTQEAPEPPTPDPTPTVTPAGKAKRRYYVEVDGQSFPVASASEAVSLLQRARAIAEQRAEVKADRVVRALKKRDAVPAITIAKPVISVSHELAADTAPLIADIERLYARAAETAELRLLLLKQLEAEDDDEDVLLIL